MESAFLRDLAYSPHARHFVRRFMDGSLPELFLGLDANSARSKAIEWGILLEAYLRRRYEADPDRPPTFRAYMETDGAVASGVVFILDTFYAAYPQQFIDVLVHILKEVPVYV